MSTQRQKHSTASTGRRRSKHHLKKQNLAICKHCKEPKLSHQLCASCQKY